VQYTRNSKISTNNGQVDRYYNKKGQYNSRKFEDSKASRNSTDLGNYKEFRDRNNHFSEYSIYNRNKHRNKYGKKENKNSFRENENKEIVDWRQRTNDVGNKSTLLKPIYHKKYKFGK
jgi:hypothetical protein